MTQLLKILTTMRNQKTLDFGPVVKRLVILSISLFTSISALKGQTKRVIIDSISYKHGWEINDFCWTTDTTIGFYIKKINDSVYVRTVDIDGKIYNKALIEDVDNMIPFHYGVTGDLSSFQLQMVNTSGEILLSTPIENGFGFCYIIESNNCWLFRYTNNCPVFE